MEERGREERGESSYFLLFFRLDINSKPLATTYHDDIRDGYSRGYYYYYYYYYY